MNYTKLSTKLIAGILTSIFFGVFIYSHSAYAASYLNVSSGGAVSLGSIRPTASGTSSTGSDTLTVHTDCSAGYSVYVSGQNGKDTNLTNSSASSDNVISTSSNAIGSAGSLSSNTWGLNHENTGKYVGLPSYSDALNAALTVKSNVEEASTVPIYYGIKVDTSITPGTYTGDVLYTVLMDSSCLTYTVQFDANSGTGTMGSQTVVTNTATALSANSFTRANYNFLGWSTSAKGKTGTAVDGVGTADDVEYSDKEAVTNLTASGSTIKLYAIWEAAGYQLSVANGNTTAIASVTLKNATTGAAITSGSNVPEGTSVTATCTNASGYHCTELVSSNTDLLASYSQSSSTAVALAYAFTMPAGAITLTANGAPNTYTLYYHPGGAYGTPTSVTATYGANISIAANSFSAPSGWSFQSWNAAVGDTGTAYSAGASVAPQAIKNSVTTANGGSAYLYATWSIPDDGNLGNMQDSTCYSVTPGHTATLTDTRDNQAYSIYRWPSTGTAGTDYPTGMAGYCIMTKDLSLGYVTGGSVTKGGDLSLTTDASTFDASGSSSSAETITLSGTQTVTYRASNSVWDTTNSYTNMQYTNGVNATNGAHSYYSYGAALVVCPKGWLLPTDAEYYNIAVFTGGNSTNGSARIRSAPYSFVTGGTFYSGGWVNVNSNRGGYYWASTQGRVLAFDDSIHMYTTSSSKNYGESVRCIAEPVEPVAECSATVHPTTSTGCKMKDGNEWIIGNNGNTTTWASSYTCPTGYSSPTKAIFDSLVSAQGSGGELYTALGLYNDGLFWSSTQYRDTNAYDLAVHRSIAGVSYSLKTSSRNVLCYKPA